MNTISVNDVTLRNVLGNIKCDAKKIKEVRDDSYNIVYAPLEHEKENGKTSLNLNSSAQISSLIRMRFALNRLRNIMDDLNTIMVRDVDKSEEALRQMFNADSKIAKEYEKMELLAPDSECSFTEKKMILNGSKKK